jgi:YVTN family beta-propeller protein
MAAGLGYVWTVSTDSNMVFAVDPTTNTVRDQIPLESAPGGIAIGGGSIWVTNNLTGKVSQISRQTLDVVQTIEVGNARPELYGWQRCVGCVGSRVKRGQRGGNTTHPHQGDRCARNSAAMTTLPRLTTNGVPNRVPNCRNLTELREPQSTSQSRISLRAGVF